MTIGLPREAVHVRGKEWSEHRARFRDLADVVGEYAGIPLKVDGLTLVLEERHPRKVEFERILSAPEPAEFRCSTTDVDDTVAVVNSWWSHAKQGRVWLYRQQGRTRVILDRSERAPGRRVTFTLLTLAAVSAWDVGCEMRARDKLRRLLNNEHLYAMYELTGAFMWTSPRSGVTYVFRRLRPTIAMVPSDRRDPQKPMRILAVLCLHPLGYYAESYAGSMVPTDDVIAHFLLASGDEPGFWRRANQHPYDAPEAGI